MLHRSCSFQRRKCYLHAFNIDLNGSLFKDARKIWRGGKELCSAFIANISFLLLIVMIFFLCFISINLFVEKKLIAQTEKRLVPIELLRRFEI